MTGWYPIMCNKTDSLRQAPDRGQSLLCRNGGFCARGDQCEFSHGVFEARLHPDSYRTVQCKDGPSCGRKICFFYHTEEEARKPTGLQDARAQLAAEMGTAAIDMDVEAIRSGVICISMQEEPVLDE
jgi:hypothetical protein